MRSFDYAQETERVETLSVSYKQTGFVIPDCYIQ